MNEETRVIEPAAETGAAVRRRMPNFRGGDGAVSAKFVDAVSGRRRKSPPPSKHGTTQPRAVSA
jgi:hypothetical protein